MLYLLPIICLIERLHTDFKEGDAVPTKVKLLHMEETMLALCLNAGTYLPRVEANLDAFIVAAQNGRKNLRFSLTEKCVMPYGSNLRNFILSVFVASSPIVQCQPPPLQVVEAVVLRSVDDLCFPGTFAAVPPRRFLFTVFHKYIRTLLRKKPPSDHPFIVLRQTMPPSTTAGQRNVDI